MFILYYFICDRVSSTGCPRTCCIDQAVLDSRRSTTKTEGVCQHRSQNFLVSFSSFLNWFSSLCVSLVWYTHVSVFSQMCGHTCEGAYSAQNWHRGQFLNHCLPYLLSKVSEAGACRSQLVWLASLLLRPCFWSWVYRRLPYLFDF